MFCYQENENVQEIKLHVVPCTLAKAPMVRQRAPLDRQTLSIVSLV